jgi:RNA polymerase sigma factor (TIGR02999 family)
MSDITQILGQVEQGDSQAAAQLLPIIYDELRKLAAAKLAHEKPGQTLQATALVHEAYLRLVGPGKSFQGRAHFFAAAAEAMRRILINRARDKGCQKRGGDLRRVNLESLKVAAAAPSEDLLVLDEALEALAAEAPACADLVKLRFFANMTMAEAAEALGLSLRTAERTWAYARSWLYCRLREPPERRN